VVPQVTTDGAGRWVAVWNSTDSVGGTIGTDRDILFATGTGPDPDTDGDGVSDGADCAPLDASTYTGAPEVNDGQDNQCPGDPGFGVVDEISGTSYYETSFCWPAQPLATEYEVVKSGAPDFSSVCMTFTTISSCISDPSPTAVGNAAYYLVRALSPSVGSWGVNSFGSERTVGPLPDSNCDGIPD